MAEPRKTFWQERLQMAEELKQTEQYLDPEKDIVLRRMLQDMIKECLSLAEQEKAQEEEERKRLEQEEREEKERIARINNAIAYEYIVVVKKLQEMEQEAIRVHNAEFANRILGITKKHLSSPEAVKAIEHIENQSAEKKVSEVKVSAEDKKLKELQEKMKSFQLRPDEKKGNKTDKEHFKTQKKMTEDYLSKMLAIQTIAMTIKSIQVGIADMAREGAGEVMSPKQIKEMTDEMLTDENVTTTAKMIRERDDFKRMMSEVNDWNSLNSIRRDAIDGSGKKIKDRLHKASQELIREDMQRALAEEQIKAAEKELPKERGLEPMPIIPNGPEN